jgi:hypothetical protein
MLSCTKPAIAPSTTSDQGSDVAGWNGVPWSTTQDHAARSLSAYHPKPGSKSTELLIEHFKIQDTEYKTELLFDASGLHRVVLHPTSNQDIPDFVVTMLREGLQDKYGKPSQHVTHLEVRFQQTVTDWTWQKQHGTVTLRYTVFDSRNSVIGLIYAKRTVLPEL